MLKIRIHLQKALLAEQNYISESLPLMLNIEYCHS